MTDISEKIREALLDLLFPLSLAGFLYGSGSFTSNVNTVYDYRDTSSWSREEKIVYLEKQLSVYKEPPMTNPKTGGIIMIWGNKKAELERLRKSS